MGARWRGLAARINYLWRLLMTAWSFSVFGLGGLALSAAVFPLLLLLPARYDLRRRVVRGLVQQSFALFVKMMCVVGIMSLDVNGGERLRRARGCLILANHPTLIDVVVMISLLPSANCVVKSALWDSVFLGGVVRAARYIRNDDSTNLIADCAASLRSGENLVIFPEGTRSLPGRPYAFLRGAAHIALAGECAILPVLLCCTPSTLSKGVPWYRIPSRRFHFSLEVLESISVDELLGGAVQPSMASRHLTKALQRYFSERLPPQVTTE
ncbi:lysophospholipid acyltransferase family protein [Paludibacterium yongneupense]|uniref:lysophospholipid acyltransferase family protein n=2 Tax=Paludibacterium yongneupense TaxID=400061 RepID=UPI00055AB3FB|nr:lysophospholipid acyltransferase family protein [Paludibacterium yongneupense]